MHILIIEDEVKISEYLAEGLQKSGYHTTVCHDGQSALIRLDQPNYDLVLLDVMLPEFDGWQILKTLRTMSQVPVLMLTARDHVLDRVKGLELGADDYLIKPFSYIELLARIKRLLLRHPRVAQEYYQVANLKLDRLKHKVWREQKLIDLTPKEFFLLQFFMEQQGQVLTRSQIASQVWNINFNTDTNVVDVAIRRLRSKVDDHFSPKLIHTVRGLGYKLAEQP